MVISAFTTALMLPLTFVRSFSRLFCWYPDVAADTRNCAMDPKAVCAAELAPTAAPVLVTRFCASVPVFALPNDARELIALKQSESISAAAAAPAARRRGPRP